MWIKRNNPALDATKTPTAIDIAWSAGFFEGEGHPRLTYKRGIDLSVTQKDPEVLYRLRDWFGGAVRFARCKTIPADKQVYQWNCCGDRARVFMALVYSFLSARRKSQIDATNALEFLCGFSPSSMSMDQLKDRLSYFSEAQKSLKWNSPEFRKSEAYRKKNREHMRKVRGTK